MSLFAGTEFDFLEIKLIFAPFYPTHLNYFHVFLKLYSIKLQILSIISQW